MSVGMVGLLGVLAIFAAYFLFLLNLYLKDKEWKWECRHRWDGTRFNPWYIQTEQTCRRCGAKRHHFFEDRRGIGEEPRWRDGPHTGSMGPSQP